MSFVCQSELTPKTLLNNSDWTRAKKKYGSQNIQAAAAENKDVICSQATARFIRVKSIVYKKKSSQSNSSGFLAQVWP
jgi:hypothetical protein